MRPLGPDDPRAIGEFRLLRSLGSGGMGHVYLGRSASGRTVAVKVVHPHFSQDRQFRERFRREVASARRVGGDWTAPVLDADPDARVPWVATGYVAGPPLQQAVEEHGPLPETAVRAVGAGLAEALRHVHGLGLVHRDVKPSNVLLALDGPRLIDFGIARATDGTASLTSSGVSIGSPGYMSPEQVLGKGVTGASDVFSLGAVLAYAATGVAPFPGDSSAALLYKVVHEEPELDGLAGELRELIAACLAKDAGDRPGPEEIAGRLTGGAEGGASALVGTGWLPGSVVERVSRSAVELLELEPEGEPGPPRSPDEPVAGGSGPVPFTTPSQGPGTQEPEPAPAPPGPRTPHPQGAFGPPPAEAPAGTPATGASVTASAGRGKRRVSCTVVLSVACVLAVVTIGAYFFRLLPGSGGGASDSAGQPPTASQQPGAGSGGSDAGGGADGTVAKDFLGSWTGEIRTDSGLANGRLTMRVSEGGKGDEAVRMVVKLPGDEECRSVGTLTKVTDEKLTLREESVGKPAEMFGLKLCTGADATVTVTKKGDDELRYASDDEAAGNPTADLTRDAP